MGTLALPAANADPELATMVRPAMMSVVAPRAKSRERARRDPPMRVRETVCDTALVNACLDKSHPH